MQYLIELIKDKNWQAILDHCKVLTDVQRYETIDFLKTLDIEKDILKESGEKLTGKKRDIYYDNRGKVGTSFYFAFIACTRSEEDLIRTEHKVNEHYTVKPFDLLYNSPYEPLIAFYTLFPPDYLNNIVKEIAKDRWKRIDFKVLWKCYEKGWVAFDEAFFIRQLLTVWMFDRNTEHDADFLFEHPEAVGQVLLQFHKHEMPILDISKWQAREGFVCKKVNEFWTEVFTILLEKGVVFDRIIVKNLLQSLQNTWKKPHLDWHIRLLDLFQATPNEYLEHQALLFSVLTTGQVSLLNFAIKQLQSISKLDGFDEVGFLENIALVFPVEKCAKSVLIALNMVEEILPKHPDIDYSDRLAIAFLQTDAALQEKTAILLARFTPKENIEAVTSPYLAYLKQKPKEILGLTTVETNIEIELAEIQHEAVKIPTTWNDLLFQIGQCIHSKSALDIDLFLEGLNQLQNEIPTDFEKQLKPYTKQLLNRHWEIDTMYYLSVFIESWISKKPFETKKRNDTHIPFLKNKCIWLFQKLKTKNKLPFLSTPTHEPFYIHSNSLIERLLMYEKSQQEVELEDLIVACNRLMLAEIDEKTIALAKQLKGTYAEAIHYFVGVSENIKPTEALLPLWTQLTRIKNPNGIFTVFENTSAKDYPSVVKPFWIDFEVKIDANEYCTWYRLILENNWNNTWFEKKKAIEYGFQHYHLASFDNANRTDIAYQLSLNPQYLDGQLCRYVPDSATGNEVNEFENCLFPLQFMLQHQLKIRHSGWIYIAVCLIFEKKISRELAAEYILVALQGKEDLSYLADTIGRLIAQKYAPINRLMEFFDKPFLNQSLKDFQLLVLERCIEHFDKENLPTNSKKIIAYQKEWAG
jgi:Family of unknown function (DUF6493)